MKLIRIFGALLFMTSFISIAQCDNVLQPKVTEEQKVKQELFSSIVTPDGKPSGELLELLEKLDIKHDGSLADIVAKTQKAWLRPVNVERFNMGEDLFVDKRDQVWPLFIKLGLIDEVYPKQKEYKYALVHGGNIISVRARISYLANLWKSGIRFGQLVFLTGQRYLDPNLETAAMLQKSFVDAICKQADWILPVRSDWKYNPGEPFKTETDMIKIVFDQMQLPEGLKKVPVMYIDALQQVDSNGKTRRPNTSDTIKRWIEVDPIPGSCLFISNQPFILYQETTVRMLMLDDFEVETVGFATQSGYDSVHMVLDSLARCIYQENEKFKK